ncbi:MAG TPA: hypothetical protein VFD63_08040 [Pyrinomonadaceae bacterium]|nr:hypothetical protein [Pyrinomonadaceae bacterium]
MPAHFGLTSVQNFYKKTDANFFITDQVDNAQPGTIGKGTKQELKIVLLILHTLRTSVICTMPLSVEFLTVR